MHEKNVDALKRMLNAAPSRVSEPPNAQEIGPRSDLRLYIDHTLLRPDARSEEFEKLCDEAIRFGFWSVCVPSSRVLLASKRLQGTNVRVCTVVGFPHGNGNPFAKAWEAAAAVSDGADEVDMVLNIGAFRDGDEAWVKSDISGVVQAAQGRLVKVILETSFLEQSDVVLASTWAAQAGAHFVKTSTGFSSAGATVANIAAMRQAVGPSVGVKASGGIRDAATADAMIAAGASRLGCSAGVSIVREQVATGSY